jgi:hypothetical protein
MNVSFLKVVAKSFAYATRTDFRFLDFEGIPKIIPIQLTKKWFKDYYE